MNRFACTKTAPVSGVENSLRTTPAAYQDWTLSHDCNIWPCGFDTLTVHRSFHSRAAHMMERFGPKSWTRPPAKRRVRPRTHSPPLRGLGCALAAVHEILTPLGVSKRVQGLELAYLQPQNSILAPHRAHNYKGFHRHHHHHHHQPHHPHHLHHSSLLTQRLRYGRVVAGRVIRSIVQPAGSQRKENDALYVCRFTASL